MAAHCCRCLRCAHAGYLEARKEGKAAGSSFRARAAHLEAAFAFFYGLCIHDFRPSLTRPYRLNQSPAELELALLLDARHRRAA